MRTTTAALAPLLLGLTWAATSVADDTPTPPIGRQAIDTEMHGYYGGERLSGYVVGALGIASVVAGGVLVTRQEDFARGLGWPLLTLGALEVIGGAFYAFQVNGEISHYGSRLSSDPAAFQREESAHMHGTTSRFIFYRIAEIGLLVAGAAVATYGFATDRDAWKGAGIGMAIVALPIVVIDTFNNARAGAYESHVNAFDPSRP